VALGAAAAAATCTISATYTAPLGTAAVTMNVSWSGVTGAVSSDWVASYPQGEF
jgi:hypothetical protein